MEIDQINDTYQNLIAQISEVYTYGQQKGVLAVNRCLVETYWHIGQHIVEFEQGGKIKAQYGQALLETLSTDLTILHGKGFSRSNLNYMRLFYQRYPICEEVPHKLSWTHLCELVKIDDPLERSFYEKQTVLENWSTTELKRQKKTALFARLALSKDKAGILQLAKTGQSLQQPADILREPYIFEFLKIPENLRLSETQLEQKLMDNLQSFLLELGKGFTFVGRQYRITLSNEHYYVDLVFYHRILRCFVLVDLKIREVHHQDIGQMNMYLGYFAHEQNIAGDNPPIGIILTHEKNELLVKYATYGLNSQLFVQKYQLYLPNQAELQALIERHLGENKNE